MKIRPHSTPSFFIDSLPDIPNTDTRELLRHIRIQAKGSDIFAWLKQLRIAPYSYDFIDNRNIRSPGYIISNLPPLSVNTHYLLAFHIFRFEENSFIVCRFCEPIITPVNLYLKDIFIEYRIVTRGTRIELWCKIKGYINRDIPSKGFFMIFSVANKIMITRQLKNIRKLSELLAKGKVEARIRDLNNYYPESGIHWWIFCRRHNCKRLIS
ncbi:MAG TPA: hypothetical protein VI583_06900 [Cyclobacteriaceae bacterium]|nr:hypothetical protein [Cyclobacteriaceae bacterium]